MARQVAIVIGVKNAGNLTPLPGAISGATDFASWAASAGFEVFKITDEREPVTAYVVKEAFKSALKLPNVERLFIYFAGHGVSQGLDVDVWLLSKWQDDADEAVNVVNSRRLAKRSGIKHIAFFADACRTTAGKSQLGIHGCTLFPPRRRPELTELDEFYAAQPGDPAQEVRDDQLQKSFGVFTDCLMAAIRGEKRKAADLVKLNGDRGLAVTAKSLADYIQMAVADRLLDIPGAANQVPDSRPGSYPPNILARFEDDPSMMKLTVEVDGPDDPGGRSPNVNVLEFNSGSNTFMAAASGPPPLEIEMPAGSLYKIEVELRGYDQNAATAGQIFQLSVDETRTPKLELRMHGAAPVPAAGPSHLRNVVVAEDGSEHATAPSDGLFRVTSRDLLTGRSASEYRYLEVNEEPARVAALPRNDAAEQTVDQLSTGVGRDHFETATGLTVLGAKLVEAWVGGGHAGLFEEDGAWHVRGFPRDHQDGRGVPRATSVLLELEDGRFAAVAMMSDFLGTVTIGQGGVAQVSYVPAPGSRFELPDFNAERAHRALARATVAVQHGRFQIAEEAAGEFARELRMYKHFNPTLGIYAAYAYDMAGSTDQVRDMIRYYEDYEQPVPYDIALLSGLQFDQISVPVAPSFPMLTQGWAYLDPDDLHPVVAQARRSLGRSLWAMPTGDDGRALAQALKNEDLQGELL